MRFPGDPYARQERHRAEQEERERILSLIRQKRARLARRRDDEMVDPDELLGELERAVGQGWRRFV